MTKSVLKFIFSAITLGVVLSTLALPTIADSGRQINKDENNLAILGYDTVAYFTQSRPIKGSDKFQHVWQDAIWQFSKAKHRDRFVEDPERYAPRYGGFCVMAMARGKGKLYKVEPEEFRIVDGKLFLNYSRKYSEQFDQDPAAAIAKADANWPRLGKAQ